MPQAHRVTQRRNADAGDCRQHVVKRRLRQPRWLRQMGCTHGHCRQFTQPASATETFRSDLQVEGLRTELSKPRGSSNLVRALSVSADKAFLSGRLQMKVSSAGTFDDVEETTLLQADAKASHWSSAVTWGTFHRIGGEASVVIDDLADFPTMFADGLGL